MTAAPRSVVFAREHIASRLRAALPEPYVLASTVAQLVDATVSRAAVAYVDLAWLDQIREGSLGVPVVGVIDPEPNTPAVSAAIAALDAHPWLAHVIATPLLETPQARGHLAILLDRLSSSQIDHPILGETGVGRVALLARASRREARFERMREYLALHDQSPRTISAVVEIAEELVMNALYDAPVESGFFATPRRRDRDVELPRDLACEISYGVDREAAFVRVRDPFGALSRDRLLDVLVRCSGGTGVELDESRGGAGLGLWRVCTMASTVAITVIPGVLTDVFATILPGRRGTRQLNALHLFFGSRRDDAPTFAEDDGLIDQSITLVLVA